VQVVRRRSNRVNLCWR